MRSSGYIFEAELVRRASRPSEALSIRARPRRWHRHRPPRGRRRPRQSGRWPPRCLAESERPPGLRSDRPLPRRAPRTRRASPRAERPSGSPPTRVVGSTSVRASVEERDDDVRGTADANGDEQRRPSVRRPAIDTGTGLGQGDDEAGGLGVSGSGMERGPTIRVTGVRIRAFGQTSLEHVERCRLEKRRSVPCVARRPRIRRL